MHSDELLLVGGGEQKMAVVVASEAQPGLEGVDAAECRECGAAFFLGGGQPFFVGGGVSGVPRVGSVVVLVRGVDVVGLRNLRVAALDGGGIRAIVGGMQAWE